MLNITTNLLNNITYISIAIIFAMVVIFAIGVINNILLKQSYSKIIKELDSINNDGMEVYNNKMLNEIVSSFKEAYLKSYDGINTQAIIEAKFYKNDKGKIGKESFLNNVSNLILTLGVVGTLYNIIVIVTKLTEMFKGVEAQSIPSMISVFGDVSTIVAYLAIAFVTTFVAIVLTFVYSLVNTLTHVDMERSNLFARIEDYLDNKLAVNLSKDKPKMLATESFANPNILYALKNTSESMMRVTAQLESTLKNLSGSIQKTIVQNSNEDNYSEDDVFEGYEQLRLERIKQIQEQKKEIDKKAAEQIENMKFANIVPNKDKIYVKEVVDEEKMHMINEEHRVEEQPIKQIEPEETDIVEEIKNLNSDINKYIEHSNNGAEIKPVIPVQPIIPPYQYTNNDYTTEELNNNIKSEERNLNSILSEEENVLASNENINTNTSHVDTIHALTADDIEALKRELIKRQEEERRIKELINNNVSM